VAAMNCILYLDPSSEAFYEDRLFQDSALNRDDCLAPFVRLRKIASSQGLSLHTADHLLHAGELTQDVDYSSLGILDNYQLLQSMPRVHLKNFFILEPPVVQPALYETLPHLTQAFEKVYVHNIDGDGYSLKNVDQSKLVKLYWPQPFDSVLMDYWQNQGRLKKIVVINGNHRPVNRRNELYSKRIEAMAVLSRFGAIDLYGRGWGRWWSRSTLWYPYWRNFRTIKKIYCGQCDSKYSVLSQYQFSLCFENMIMSGYLTEKIFDCLYAGTIPLYLGAPDIDQYIPQDAYIDCRNYESWEDLWRFVSTLSESEINDKREAGRAFIESHDFQKYYHSLEYAFGLLNSDK